MTNYLGRIDFHKFLRELHIAGLEDSIRSGSEVKTQTRSACQRQNESKTVDYYREELGLLVITELKEMRKLSWVYVEIIGYSSKKVLV